MMVKNLRTKTVSYFIYFFKKWSFALVLAAIMLAFQYSVILGTIMLAPPDHFWLGATIANSSDTAIYINYISQSANSPLLTNFYAGPEHIARFDPFWIFGGLFVRLGTSAIQAHEILRVITTIILAFAILATAKSVTKNATEARVASVLILFGTSTGWIYSVYLTIANSWSSTSIVPADLGSEFAISSVLLGGAHMILSLALLLLNTRWLWEIISKKRKLGVLPIFTLAFHVSFHPYFIPIYGLISIFSLSLNRDKQSFFRFLILNSTLLPGAIYYIYLIFNDTKLREHHLITNNLILDPLWSWLIILLPISIAYIWILWNKSKLNLSGNTWIWIWLIASLICIASPLPWNRKFTQALLPALTILTLPFWLHIYHSLKPKKDLILKASLLFLLSFPYLHLLQSELALTTDPNLNQYFYASNDTKKAWQFLKSAPANSLILCTNIYNCLWTPAQSGNYVWIGHRHETPNFSERYEAYKNWLSSKNASNFKFLLQEQKITHVISHKKDYEMLFNADWQKTFEAGNISIWQLHN